MGKAIFFVKGSLSIQVPVKALEAVEAGQKSPFFKYMSTIFFLIKLKFLNDSFTTTLYLLDFIEFHLHLVYFIMQIFPVTRG
jgi:hypothetical protein